MHIVWTLIWNIASVGIFLGMLSVATSDFETVAIAGIGLVFVTVVAYCQVIAREQFDGARRSVEYFIRLSKMIDSPEDRSYIEELEAAMKGRSKLYLAEYVSYAITLVSLVVLLGCALFSIFNVLW